VTIKIFGFSSFVAFFLMLFLLLLLLLAIVTLLPAFSLSTIQMKSLSTLIG